MIIIARKMQGVYLALSDLQISVTNLHNQLQRSILSENRISSRHKSLVQASFLATRYSLYKVYILYSLPCLESCIS